MKGMFQQFYDPVLVSSKPNLAEFVDPEPQAVRDVVEEKIRNAPLAKLISGSEIPKPLTLAEAQAIVSQIIQTKNDIARTRNRISGILSQIDNAGITSQNGREIGFSININKKTQLKRAIKKVFGVNTNTITYSMYRAALNAKRQLEKEETDEYVNEK